MKRIIIFLGLIVLIFLLGSCNSNEGESSDNESTFDSLKELKGSFILDLIDYYRTKSDYDIENYVYKMDIDNVRYIGKYNEGYLFVIAYVAYPDLDKYGEIVIDGIKIKTTYETHFFYYKDFEIYEGLEIIYEKGFVNTENLLDINSKFEMYCDYQYYIIDDFPFDN